MPTPPPAQPAVCSWSLRPASAADLAAKVKAVGLSAIQLALDHLRRSDPGWTELETLHALRAANIRILSGMMAMQGEDYSTLESIRLTGGIRPDHTWETNLAAARANARLARRLGIPLVTCHAGFIPHEPGDERTTMLRRLRVLADVFDDCGVRLALETGQETADTLLEALAELAAMGGAQVGVNFDPANMILYGMGNPVEAAAKLAPHIAQVHIKDATPTTQPGTWGTEIRAGTGGKRGVDWPAFFRTLNSAGVTCDLVIEREAREERIPDVIAARKLIEKLAHSRPSARRSTTRKSSKTTNPRKRSSKR